MIWIDNRGFPRHGRAGPSCRKKNPLWSASNAILHSGPPLERAEPGCGRVSAAKRGSARRPMLLACVSAHGRRQPSFRRVKPAGSPTWLGPRPPIGNTTTMPSRRLFHTANPDSPRYPLPPPMAKIACPVQHGTSTFCDPTNWKASFGPCFWGGIRNCQRALK